MVTLLGAIALIALAFFAFSIVVWAVRPMAGPTARRRRRP